jgi:hypothetical protein
MPAPRKHDPTIPSWIDQAKIPTGAYWNRRDGYWYTIVREPTPKRMRIADGTATLWDLDEFFGKPGGSNQATLDRLMHSFSRSEKYKRLAPATQSSYGYSRLAIQKFISDHGRHFSDFQICEVTTSSIQRMVDRMAVVHRSKANLVKRYLSTLFAWGINQGLASSNPAREVVPAKSDKHLDVGVVSAVQDAPRIRPQGKHRIKWISDHNKEWMFNSSVIVEKSVKYSGAVTGDGGIYFLILGEKICYVGQSFCINTRVREHAKKGLAFDRVAAIRGVPKWAMDEVEQCYIAALNPPLNIERSRFGQMHDIRGIGNYISGQFE